MKTMILSYGVSKVQCHYMLFQNLNLTIRMMGKFFMRGHFEIFFFLVFPQK